MNLKEFFEKLTEFYKKAVCIFEKLFDEYIFESYDISEYEKVYVIEDSFVAYFGIKKTTTLTDEEVDYYLKNDYGRFSTLTGHIFIIEELTYNQLLKINATKLRKEIFGQSAPYAPYIYKFFNGDINKPIKALNSLEEEKFNEGNYEHLKTNFYRVDDALPFIELKKRVDLWEGIQYFFIIYELIENNQKGYAIYYTANPQIHKIAREKANDVEWCALEQYAWVVNYKPELLKEEITLSQEYVERKYFHQGVKCDGIIINLMIKRIDEYKKQGWVHKYQKKVSSNTLCIAEHDMKYFWISRYVKSSVPADVLRVANEIFSDVHKGKYSDEPRYEYLILENKWKSEQLVYEITKKLYKKKTVLYQHRPFFLKSEKGQMSYDVFICGLNVAIEYQGKQHFEPVEIFGGEEHYKEQVARDKLKYRLSRENGVALVYINYWDDISPELIRERIENELSMREAN